MRYGEILAQTLLRRFSDPDAYPYRFWCYPQGFMLWGFIRLFERTGNPTYQLYVLRYAQQHVTEKGEVLGFTGSSMDDMMAGSILVWAYSQTKEERYLAACRRIRQAFDDYPRTSHGAFWHARSLPGEFWVDGAFMGLMFLMHYGHFIEDSTYCCNEAVRQLALAKRLCGKKDSGLLLHAYSENAKPSWADPQTGQSPEVWSEGLGWYALILVETLSMLPGTHPGRAQLESQLGALLKALLGAQDRATGLWYQVVDKPDGLYNWHDSSGSAMFAYAMLRAMEMGVAGDEYKPAVGRAYAGLAAKTTLTEDGLLDLHDACDGLCVQDSYEKYTHYPRRINAKEAVAAFFWFVVAYEKGGKQDA